MLAASSGIAKREARRRTERRNETFFKDKIAVVTGAGGTLCSAVAIELARLGAKVALLGRTVAKLEPVAAAIRAGGGTALPLSVDVTDAAAVEAARQRVAQELGPCALLVNGAGGNRNDAVTTTTEFQPAEISDARPEGMGGFFNLEPDRMLDVICAGLFACCRHTAPT